MPPVKVVLVAVLSGVAVAVLVPRAAPVASQSAGAQLVAAVLPSSRSALVGAPVTAFVAVVNPGPGPVPGVGVFLRTPVSASLAFQTTNPATNLTTGAPGALVSLPAGATQTFLITLTPTAPFPPTMIEFDFSTAADRVATIAGVNTLLLSASAVPVPDLIAVGATTSRDGILDAAVSGAVATALATLKPRQPVALRHPGAFAVAVTNVGAAATITARARSSGASSVTLAMRETDPATGAVIGTDVKSVASGQTATFGVFAAAGTVPFDPAANRIVVEFLDEAGVVRGATSVAFTTRRGERLLQGAELFFNERFDGNGRTCATCHPADNNFTLDPGFIARLPADDPLFVSETNPALAGLENPRLLREFALVLENVDGFDRPGVLRGVPHMLALATSVQSFAGPRTGWSGDGAPGDGTLRSFALGAVTQHFTRTPARIAGVDFRAPTDAELEALDAFQLALGRQADPSLPLPLRGARARNGQAVFLDDSVGRCNRCHVNAGATANFGGPSLGNDNFDTAIDRFAPQRPRPPGEIIPPDGGFGSIARGVSPGGFGDGRFNTPPLVEAADTPPFFHNNNIETIEDAVAFYTSAEFNGSPGAFEAGGPIDLDPAQVTDVAAFLRVINALENIRSAGGMLDDARGLTAEPALLARILALAAKDLDDAIRVLEGGALHPEAVVLLRAAHLAASQHVIETASSSTLAARALLVEE